MVSDITGIAFEVDKLHVESIERQIRKVMHELGIPETQEAVSMMNIEYFPRELKHENGVISSSQDFIISHPETGTRIESNSTVYFKLKDQVDIGLFFTIGNYRTF